MKRNSSDKSDTSVQPDGVHMGRTRASISMILLFRVRDIYNNDI